MSTQPTAGGGYGSPRPPVGAGLPGAPAAGAGAGAPVDTFTAEMRDRQARGKDPYESSDGSSEWASEGTKKYRAGGGKDEPFAVLERRRVASQVLDSPELLMMAAQRDNESIPAIRLRYTRMLCGLEEPSPARKKSYRGLSSSGSGSSTSRVPSGSTPGRSSRKDVR
ncbi:hypothetical protein F5Y06DRAFT_186968 [Hypoxylon sp. FL0890]|nr:hypothetical protein F5Y06DRAFT_186968 [Hypoxylon sp. FL0890]